MMTEITNQRKKHLMKNYCRSRKRNKYILITCGKCGLIQTKSKRMIQELNQSNQYTIKITFKDSKNCAS